MHACMSVKRSPASRWRRDHKSWCVMNLHPMAWKWMALRCLMHFGLTPPHFNSGYFVIRYLLFSFNELQRFLCFPASFIECKRISASDSFQSSWILNRAGSANRLISATTLLSPGKRGLSLGNMFEGFVHLFTTRHQIDAKSYCHFTKLQL